MSNSAPEDLVKVIFDLERDEDGYPPADYEHLWARPLGDNLYELDNTPFFVRGVSTSDVVVAEPDTDNNLRFKAVKTPSQHTTLRVIVFRETSDARAIEERVRDLRTQLTNLGCSSELSHLPGLIAVDVPPEVSVESVTDVLAEGEARDLWEYEEAALRG